MIPIGSKVRVKDSHFHSQWLYGVVTAHHDFRMKDFHSVNLPNSCTYLQGKRIGGVTRMVSESDLEVISEEEFAAAIVVEG
jgi:hypothetical protein